MIPTLMPVVFWLIDKLARLSDSLRLLKNPKNPIVDRFYDHPEIKYLGSSGVFKNPSSFKAVSFSKTLLYLLNGAGPMDRERIDNELRNVAPKILGPQTTQYVLSLWEDSHGDIVKFKLQLEAWFERTMEQATEWYKRKIRKPASRTKQAVCILHISLQTLLNRKE